MLSAKIHDYFKLTEPALHKCHVTQIVEEAVEDVVEFLSVSSIILLGATHIVFSSVFLFYS